MKRQNATSRPQDTDCYFLTVEKIGKIMEKCTLHVKDTDHVKIIRILTKQKNPISIILFNLVLTGVRRS